MRTVLVCLIGAVSAVAFAAGSPASADSLKSVVRTLNAIVNPEDAWRLEDQARRHDRPHEERYWRNYGAGLEQQRRERGEAVLPHGGWHQYSAPIGPERGVPPAIPGAARWSFQRGKLLGSLSGRARTARTATVIAAARFTERSGATVPSSPWRRRPGSGRAEHRRDSGRSRCTAAARADPFFLGAPLAAERLRPVVEWRGNCRP